MSTKGKQKYTYFSLNLFFTINILFITVSMYYISLEYYKLILLFVCKITKRLTTIKISLGNDYSAFYLQ